MKKQALSIALALCTFLASFQSGMVLKVHAADTPAAGSISFTENPTKIYDGKAVEDPSIDTNGDGAVTYTYYKVAGREKTKLEGTPSDAGEYKVEASLAGTEHYSAASAVEGFTIIQRPVSLGLSIHVSGDSATLTAFVNNAVDAAGKVQFTITPQGSEAKNIEAEATVADAEEGMFEAITTEQNLGAGTYSVTAEYVAGDPQNYSCAKSATGSFDKAKADRNIQGESSFEVTYGSASFNLDASASAAASAGAQDQFSYEVVGDEYADYGLASSVTVDSSGQVTIWNAGTAYIKITLKDSKSYYNEVTKFVRVKISPAELTVTSYAEDSGIATKADAEYGALSGITYGLDYTGFKGSDNKDTFTSGHGTLSAVPLPAVSGAGTYTIGIRQTGGGTITVNETNYDNIFLSWNYHIKKTYGSFIVNPKSLTVQANNVTATYGDAEPDYSVSMDGFASGDTAGSVFSVQPTAYLNPTASSYPLKPGSYVITPTGGTQKANAKGLYNYRVTLSNGTLTVNKRILDLSGMSWSGGNFTYDGTEHGLTLSGTPPKEVTVTKSGDTATNAGSYTASAAFALADGYEAADYELRGTNPLTKDWKIAQASLSGTKNPVRTLRCTDTSLQTLTAEDFGISAPGSFSARGAATGSGNALEKITYGENVQYTLKSGLTISNQTLEIPVTFTPADGNYTPVDLTVKVTLVEKYTPAFTLAAVRNGNSLICTATLKKDRSITDAPDGEVNFYLDTAGTGKPFGTKKINSSAENADITLDLNKLDPGVHTIYAVYSGNTVFAAATASVSANRVSIGGISLNKPVLVLNTRKTETLKVTASPADATIQTVTWESDDPEIATVDGTGTVTAVGAGATRITATSDDNPDISASCKVIVADTSDVYLEQLQKDDVLRSGVNAVYASPSDASMSDAVIEFVDWDVLAETATASNARASQKFTLGKAQTLLHMIWDSITYTIWHVFYVEDAGTSRYIYVHHNRILTVTFDPNGGSADRQSEKTDEDGRLSDIPSARRSGYNFDGWFTSPAGGEQLKTDTQCDADTIYYAHWTQNAADQAGSGSESGNGNGTKANSETPNVSGTWVSAAGQDGTKWQFKKTDGTMAKDTWIRTGDKWYHFDSNGYAQTGWVLDQGKWYHCDSRSCAMDTGLYHDNADSHDYYLNADGSMATGWVTINGKQYYFSPDAAVSTYTYDPVTQTWIWNNADILPYGAMLKNTITPDGHHVDETGARTD